MNRCKPHPVHYSKSHDDCIFMQPTKLLVKCRVVYGSSVLPNDMINATWTQQTNTNDIISGPRLQTVTTYGPVLLHIVLVWNRAKRGSSPVHMDISRHHRHARNKSMRYVTHRPMLTAIEATGITPDGATTKEHRASRKVSNAYAHS